MEYEKIIFALRCISRPDQKCIENQCPFFVKENIPEEMQQKCGMETWYSCDVDGVGLAAADAMERLVKERDMARAERDVVQKAYIAATGGAN